MSLENQRLMTPLCEKSQNRKQKLRQKMKPEIKVIMIQWLCFEIEITRYRYLRQVPKNGIAEIWLQKDIMKMILTGKSHKNIETNFDFNNKNMLSGFMKLIFVQTGNDLA